MSSLTRRARLRHRALSTNHERLDEQITGIRCDHQRDDQVEAAFDLIVREAARIDILVNNVWGAYERMVENGVFTWSKPFWEQPLWRWDRCSARASGALPVKPAGRADMIAQRRGLIVNISFWAAQKYIGNVAYGVSKAATDKMTADMATELKPYGVAVVSLYPGLVRTEKSHGSRAMARLDQFRVPEFIGRAVAALAADPDVLRHTGKVLVAAGLAKEYGFTDIDGTTPVRSPSPMSDVPAAEVRAQDLHRHQTHPCNPSHLATQIADQDHIGCTGRSWSHQLTLAKQDDISVTFSPGPAQLPRNPLPSRESGRLKRKHLVGSLNIQSPDLARIHLCPIKEDRMATTFTRSTNHRVAPIRRAHPATSFKPS